MHEFETLENAVLSALNPLLNDGLKELDTYVGQLEVDRLEDLLTRFPCMYVTVSDMRVPAHDPSGRYRISFSLLTGDRNLRGASAAARGSSTRNGVYDWLEMSRSRVHRKVLAPGWKSFRLASEQPLIYVPKKYICLFESTYVTEI